MSASKDIVYKIPYRRAPRLACRLHSFVQPLGRVRCASKGILHTSKDIVALIYKFVKNTATCLVYSILQDPILPAFVCKTPFLARALGPKAVRSSARQ